MNVQNNMKKHDLSKMEVRHGYIKDDIIKKLTPRKQVVVHVIDLNGDYLVEYGEHIKGNVHVHNDHDDRLDGLTQAYLALDSNDPIYIGIEKNNHIIIQGTRNPDFTPVSLTEMANIIQQMIK